MDMIFHTLGRNSSPSNMAGPIYVS